MVKYKGGNSNKPETIELHILDCSNEGIANKVKFSPSQKTSETKSTKVAKKTPRVAKQSVPSGNFKKKIEWFKGNYEWESEETMELAGHLLDIMPDEAKQPGFEKLVKSLDKKIKGKNVTSIEILIGSFILINYFIQIPQYRNSQNIRNRHLKELPQIQTVLIFVFIEYDINSFPVLFKIPLLIFYPGIRFDHILIMFHHSLNKHLNKGSP